MGSNKKLLPIKVKVNIIDELTNFMKERLMKIIEYQEPILIFRSSVGQYQFYW